MSDILIRVEGRAGRITLNRPQALNALTWEMCLAIEAALDSWQEDPAVALVVIDGAGARAFSSGGDIAEMYRTAKAGNYDYGRRFWSDEYRLNAKIAAYPKPYVAFMHGFTMGGGVGVSAHGSHRIVGESSKIAMPECGIGLIPDVGGSLLLARAPGRLGAYLGTTGHRMGPGDAILAGFADHFLPEADWPALLSRLEATGDAGEIAAAARPAPQAPLAARKTAIDRLFAAPSLREVIAALAADTSPFAAETLATLREKSPLAAACAFDAIGRACGLSVPEALALEYRFSWRSAEHGDFIEGIRAAIIDRDRSPRWRHARLEEVTETDIAAMLASLGDDELRL